MLHRQATNSRHDSTWSGLGWATGGAVCAIETEPGRWIGEEFVHFSELQKRHLPPREQGAVRLSQLAAHRAGAALQARQQ